MAIMATDTGGGGDFSPMPQGNHVAVCNMVVDLGLQRTVSQQYGEKVKHQVYIRWETPDETIEWEDRDGNKKLSPDVRVNEISLQGGKRDAAMDDDSGYGAPAPRQSAPSAPPAAPRRMEPKPASKADDFMDDDIPF